MNNHNNSHPYLNEYLQSLTDSRYILGMVANTLRSQEQNVQTILNMMEHERRIETNERSQPTPRTTNRWYYRTNTLPTQANTQPRNRTQPNFPPRVNRFNNNFFRDLFNLNMEPVVIRPTADQLSHATSTIRVGDIPLASRYYNVCPISYETFTDDTIVTRINHCGHFFDTNSINSWFDRNVRCPVCRYDIRDTVQQHEQQNITFHDSTDLSGNVDVSSNVFSDTSSTDTSANIYNTPTSTTTSTSTTTTTSTSTPIFTTDTIENLFSTLQQYMNSYNLNPSVVHLEYSIVPFDASNNDINNNNYQ